MFGGIRLKDYADGKKIRVVANEFGVTQSAISQAINLGTTFVFSVGGENKAFIIKELGTSKICKLSKQK